ncbi:phosphoribosylformylglycinamidine synthase subunit PurS [Peribacillus sp. NPDC060186]|jgi:phosphoribosylformylglycinamidine synthase|uniref:Phosphoribosylformylglycinamidine synthase subunit PurS n=1 Tax=Peribacillus butanolivorans TaxID=421767 RepID=A0AAX0S1V8_9BACI|nr:MULTISPECIES: phosphoribosylformylglycinamidine synthase subunit PurS [Peribacillus]AXN39336.1 phosphoribosylformylglycinamidine synthase subunit PurS [Peribacillus butanolivorans]MCO0596160.1 phosphoribosylformylglycinamidine synthase subunit PurS [Peribacillus butanolivorans]MED3691057.1 phosphoribosylformylglycinamidine synthase subunit PurS [Peribacillus butanolivorans]PEJ30877.1 phosphoribosylformylglycinamidine synthase subunit PurS [Peribacillus butanolivorans]QNU06665.1 phosphoribos
MYKVKVYITLRESVLDPQGAAVQQSLHSLTYNEVSDVRVGKYIELTIEDTDRDLDQLVKEMCEKLLANTVIESYRYDVEEVITQ